MPLTDEKMKMGQRSETHPIFQVGKGVSLATQLTTLTTHTTHDHAYSAGTHPHTTDI